MNEEAFNLSIRKFLKVVGVNSQREIEQAVAAALAEGRLAAGRPLRATMTLELPTLHKSVTFEGEIVVDDGGTPA